MERQLDIQIKEDILCNYLVKDLSSIDGTNRICFEFIVNNGEVIYKNEFEIENTIDTYINIEKDGLCQYYRLIVPTLEYYKKEEIYKTDYHCFYFNGKFYKPFESIIDIDNLESGCEEISDINEIWELNEDSNVFYYSNTIFSICNLRKCLLYKIGDTLLEFIDNGCIKCNIDKYLTLYRDFLISSIYVLNLLIKNNNYAGAQKIIDIIESCDSSLCSSYSSNISNNCNCGKS